MTPEELTQFEEDVTKLLGEIGEIALEDRLSTFKVKMTEINRKYNLH